jgi:hypothetical protein
MKGGKRGGGGVSKLSTLKMTSQAKESSPRIQAKEEQANLNKQLPIERLVG